jgi:hypothetical protein
MEQQEIERRNSDIAIMLGWKITDGIISYIPEESSFQHEVGYSASGFLQFHSDWNWLMEAVYHLELKLVKPVNITQGMCTISRGYAGESKEPYVRVDKWRMGSKEFNYDYKKEAVFIAVSDFAQKLNNKEL